MEQYANEYLIKMLSYSADNPMIFTRSFFWIFFTVVFLFFSILYKRITLRNLFLFLVSVYFYYKTSGFYFVLLLFTVCSDYTIAQLIYRINKKWIQRVLLGVSVTVNLSILAYFKYAYFFTDSFNSIFHTDHEVWNYFAYFKSNFTGSGSIMDRIILPVGISFYTFQAISYTVDVYKRKIKPLNNILDFGFYVSFFPQLVAGPIVRAAEFIPQIHKPYRLNGYKFGLALFMILTGLIKKMVFGDYMAVQFIDKVYANPVIFTGFENLMAVFAYSLQVYLDFSGYTDIAIGLALLLGFRFNINFNSPYKALNVGEFWKRWHISLSSWLKDYLYIPLGGNRGGSLASYILITLILIILVLLTDDYSLFWKLGLLYVAAIFIYIRFSSFRKVIDTNINLMITMILGGLWHGSSWNFVTWGGLNGLGLVFYKYWRKISPYENWNAWYVRAFKIAITFLFISFTRIWFRAPDRETAEMVLMKLRHDLDFGLAPEIFYNFRIVFGLLLLGMVIHWLPSSLKQLYKRWFIRTHVVVKVFAVLVTAVLIWQTISAELVPFIYFQF